MQKAIEVALQVGVRNIAGLAALTMVEELDHMSLATLQAAYQQAREWLADCDSPEVLKRLSNGAGKVVSSIKPDLSTEEATEILLTGPRDLQGRMLRYENTLIKQALLQANGSVTHAASLLGLSYQALCYIIESRHQDLLKDRTPIRRRAKKTQ